MADWNCFSLSSGSHALPGRICSPALALASSRTYAGRRYAGRRRWPGRDPLFLAEAPPAYRQAVLIFSFPGLDQPKSSSWVLPVSKSAQPPSWFHVLRQEEKFESQAYIRRVHQGSVRA